MTPAEIHNRDVGDIVRAIIKPTLGAGGEFSASLVILESVVLGVLLLGNRIGYSDELVLDKLVEGVKARLAEQQLKDAKPEGSA